ncbi:peptidase family M1-domain-containing protein [Coniochaeta sp. 2T2.1]|nr:peptidase family M1-domain-containing protein [Coniochaeta sp. 2T2.1]
MRYIRGLTSRLITPSLAAQRSTVSISSSSTVNIRLFTTTGAMAAPRDPNTNSNYDAWRTQHTTANLTIDFATKRLRGSVTLDLVSQTDKASNEIILDTSFVDVSSVKVNGSPAKQWELKARKEPNGTPLHVSVPDGADKGATVSVEMEVATTDKCTALQWLTPEQTGNKKAPFMFSQCQAIHARSVFPCQDTPDVKATVSFHIRSPYAVIASGVQVGDVKNEGEEKVYHFEQKVPIPSYLFALASGDIVTARIGKQSVVASGPNEIEACKWEFEEDMDRFMEAAESITGVPYQWGEYNVLILPPSFPYGGMENPVFTFATPTIVSGDRQNVDVVAHELSHSWSGNLVTNGTWENMFLNEGWTMYLERRIIEKVHGSSAHFHFSAIIGWKALEESVKGYGAEHEFTKLHINHRGKDGTPIDPDDAFSTVPYEKGFHFVWYLERLVGREAFDKFITFYFTKWSGKSLDKDEFKDTYLEFFGRPEYASLKDKLAAIDWEGMFHTPGLPPKPEFDTSLVDVCYDLAEKWKSKDFKPQASDLSSWTGNQKLVFLQALQDFKESLTCAQSESLGKVYGFADSKNVELKAAYYLISLKARDEPTYAGVANLLGGVGRMKFVRPLFKSLNKADPKLARSTFEKNRNFYHPICRQMVEKDLGLAEAKT